MKVLVSTRNITHSCGKFFLENDRIILQEKETSSRIYKNVEDYNRGITHNCPVDFWKFENYFRDANEAEEKAFYEGIKSITQIPVI